MIRFLKVAWYIVQVNSLMQFFHCFFVATECTEIIHAKKGREMNMKAMQKRGEVIRPGYSYGNITHGIFHQQIPAYIPGNEFTHACIGICIGTSANGKTRSKFCIGER